MLTVLDPKYKKERSSESLYRGDPDEYPESLFKTSKSNVYPVRPTTLPIRRGMPECLSRRLVNGTNHFLSHHITYSHGYKMVHIDINI